MPGFEVVFLIFGLAIGYGAGRVMTKEPSEDEMFQQIVNLRYLRKVKSNTHAALESEVESIATARADQ